MLTFIVQRNLYSILNLQYQNKCLKLNTNSTYLADFEDWDDTLTNEVNFMEWLSQMVGV